MKHYGNVCDIKGDKVEPVYCITFGAPCQDLSVAGKRAGMKHSDHGDYDETTRSGLFYEAVRIIKEMRYATTDRGTDGSVRLPRYAIYENVPGAFSSNGGDDWRCVLEAMARIIDPSVTVPGPEKGKWSTSGYILLDGGSMAWRVFDAQYWGVPQRRRRICLLADLDGYNAPGILFNSDEQWRESDSYDRYKALTHPGLHGTGEVQPFCEGLSGNPEPRSETWQGTPSNSEDCSGISYTMQQREGCDGGAKGL